MSFLRDTWPIFVLVLTIIAVLAVVLILSSGPACEFYGGASGTCVLPVAR